MPSSFPGSGVGLCFPKTCCYLPLGKTVCISWQIRIVLATQFSLVPWGHARFKPICKSPVPVGCRTSYMCPSVAAAVGPMLAIPPMTCGYRGFISLKLFPLGKFVGGWVFGFFIFFNFF